MRFCKLRKKTLSLTKSLAAATCSQPKKEKRLNANDTCAIAFGTCQRRTFLAERYDRSKQTIRRAFAFTGLTVLEIQLKLLQDLKNVALAKPPDFSAASLSWDETSQILSLESMDTKGGPVLRHQTSSSWEVMVCRLHLAIGWMNGVKLYREFVIPPLPLSSNSASSLKNALFNHPLTESVLQFVSEILEASKLSAWIHETDGHLANEKLHFELYHKRLQESETRKPNSLPCLTEQVLCQNHQVQLTVVSAVDRSFPICSAQHFFSEWVGIS